MGLMSHIDLAPKNGDFIILRDLRSGSWEVGRWAQESGSWVQIDGKPLRLFQHIGRPSRMILLARRIGNACRFSLLQNGLALDSS